MSYVIALNDGDTYTDLEGCRIVNVPDKLIEEDPDGIESFLKETLHTPEGHVIYEFDGSAEDFLPMILELEETVALRDEIKAALEGDSNDAEHDALASVAEALGIEYEVPDA